MILGFVSVQTTGRPDREGFGAVVRRSLSVRNPV